MHLLILYVPHSRRRPRLCLHDTPQRVVYWIRDWCQALKKCGGVVPMGTSGTRLPLFSRHAHWHTKLLSRLPFFDYRFKSSGEIKQAEGVRPLRAGRCRSGIRLRMEIFFPVTSRDQGRASFGAHNVIKLCVTMPVANPHYGDQT